MNPDKENYRYTWPCRDAKWQAACRAAWLASLNMTASRRARLR